MSHYAAPAGLWAINQTAKQRYSYCVPTHHQARHYTADCFFQGRDTV